MSSREGSSTSRGGIRHVLQNVFTRRSEEEGRIERRGYDQGMVWPSDVEMPPLPPRRSPSSGDVTPPSSDGVKQSSSVQEQSGTSSQENPVK